MRSKRFKTRRNSREKKNILEGARGLDLDQSGFVTTSGSHLLYGTAQGIKTRGRGKKKQTHGSGGHAFAPVGCVFFPRSGEIVVVVADDVDHSGLRRVSADNNSV